MDPTPSIETLLTDPGQEAEWARTCDWARERSCRDPSVEFLLFLTGIDSRARPFATLLNKDMNQDLIMDGTYAVLSEIGVYRRTGDATGWERIQTVPVLSELDQERLLQTAIARYLAKTLQADP